MPLRMDESFLHFVWHLQKFDRSSLITTRNEPIVIFHQGTLNSDSGPDFEEARIKIGDVEWAGRVEIHLRSSDWIRHRHSADPAYHNVILHVVWDHDKDIYIEDQLIPTLTLKNRVAIDLLAHYQRHINQQEVIACSSQLSSKMDLPYLSMIDKAMVERLQAKAGSMLTRLSVLNNDWDELCYEFLLTNFGFSVNKYAFRRLSEVLPFRVLKKNLTSLKRTQALFFGQAGFLDKIKDAYQKELSDEHSYLRRKYNLNTKMDRHQWKFGRMRPANFPTLRLAQLSALVSSNSRLFSRLTSITTPNEVHELVRGDHTDYWMTHYDFGKLRTKSNNLIGKSAMENIVINTVAPLFAAYSIHTDDSSYMNKALHLLESIPAEKNKIIRAWNQTGKYPKSAFESQAQIQLYNEYCKKRKCLSCAVGVTLLTQ